MTKAHPFIDSLQALLTSTVNNSNKAKHLQRGENSEQLACDYLLAQGLKTVARNYRCRFGELDLIMRDGDSLVIVEVRYRGSDTYGSALESITPRKQSRIIAATHCYLKTSPQKSAIRFDVVAISGNRPLEWIKNAFQS